MDKDTSGSWSMLVERTGRQDGDDALLEALGQNALDVETQTWNEDKAYGKSLKKSSSGNEAPEPLELLKQGTALQNALDSFLANAGGKLGPGDTLLMHHLQNDFISGSMKARSLACGCHTSAWVRARTPAGARRSRARRTLASSTWTARTAATWCASARSC